MIGSLYGTMLERNGETILLDVNGVGYEVTVTASVLERLSGGDQKVRVTVYTDMKENSLSLYGFQNSLERSVFLLLKKVKGIGSKTALTVLSALGGEGVLTSVGRNDITRLKQVPGIGNKTAERLIVELRESVGELATANNLSTPGETTPLTAQIQVFGAPFNHAESDVILALEKLGFSGERARSVVRATLEKHLPTQPKISVDSGELLKLALGNI